MSVTFHKSIYRWHYADEIADFLSKAPATVLGELVSSFPFAIEQTQRHAWSVQIEQLQQTLPPYAGRGKVYFEYDVPRMGKRIDVLLLIEQVLFVVEYKVGETDFPAQAIAQVWDYALDLKNFHESSHAKTLLPILVSTQAASSMGTLETDLFHDAIYRPICTHPQGLGELIQNALDYCDGERIDTADWEAGRYAPTPTLVEAAMVLYAGHSVTDISRSDAGARNLRQTSQAIEQLIDTARQQGQKILCLVTGVPGAGKTLVGLNIATAHTDASTDSYAVYLSGNGPLVSILHEALTRDQMSRDKERGKRTTKGQAKQAVKEFIQNVRNR